MSLFAKKSLGQNFLMHRQTAERIVEAAKLPEYATVLEIGPGTGMLTKVLLQKAGKVIAVEADTNLVPQLQETFANEIAAGKLGVIHADIRSFNPEALPSDYYLVANIPYYITGEILRQFLSASHKPRSMTVLVQKEVAERVVRSKKESLLSLSVKTFGKPSYAFTVPRGAFNPAPKVDSAVLHIAEIASVFNTKDEEAWFFEVLHAGFAHKRKQLANNLASVAGMEKVLRAFEKLDLDRNVRAEDVPLQSWVALAKSLEN